LQSNNNEAVIIILEHKKAAGRLCNGAQPNRLKVEAHYSFTKKNSRWQKSF